MMARCDKEGTKSRAEEEMEGHDHDVRWSWETSYLGFFKQYLVVTACLMHATDLLKLLNLVCTLC